MLAISFNSVLIIAAIAVLVPGRARPAAAATGARRGP